MKHPHIVLIAAPLALALPLDARGDEGPKPRITIALTGLGTNDGMVRCALFASKEGFPADPKRSVARVEVRPKAKKATCVFSGVDAGRYAVAVWHDVDGDGELDSNFLGIPQEPVAASNNAEGSFGPPSFEDAAFDLGSAGVEQTIRLD